jgi:hypothetical protein
MLVGYNYGNVTRDKTKLRETPKTFITTFTEKLAKGTRLITEPNSNKMKDWAIRNEVPNVITTRLWETLNDRTVLGLRGLVNSNDGLRYSLVPRDE